MKNVKEKIQEAGLSIAFPARQIHMVKDQREKRENPPAE
jgi:small-conductance mechanosensitive channel